jgi:DNA-binding transcriptional LysR family regulator
LSVNNPCITGGGDKDSFLDRYLAAHGRKRNISVTVPFFSSAFQILVRSQMLLTIPLHIAVNARRHFPITHREFPMSVPTEQYYLLWHGIHHNDPAHCWLREQILPPLMNSTYGP